MNSTISCGTTPRIPRSAPGVVEIRAIEFAPLSSAKPSSLRMTPPALETEEMLALETEEMLTVKASSLSPVCVSPATLIVSCIELTPAAKTATPAVATKSVEEAAAVPLPVTFQPTVEAVVSTPLLTRLKTKGVEPVLPSARSAAVAKM